MPKYIPTEQDIYPIKACPICGMDFYDDKEACPGLCEQQWEYFKEDFERSFMEDLKKSLDRFPY
jgi:hypothetical protein